MHSVSLLISMKPVSQKHVAFRHVLLITAWLQSMIVSHRSPKTPRYGEYEKEGDEDELDEAGKMKETVKRCFRERASNMMSTSTVCFLQELIYANLSS